MLEEIFNPKFPEELKNVFKRIQGFSQKKLIKYHMKTASELSIREGLCLGLCFAWLDKVVLYKNYMYEFDEKIELKKIFSPEDGFLGSESLQNAFYAQKKYESFDTQKENIGMIGKDILHNMSEIIEKFIDEFGEIKDKTQQDKDNCIKSFEDRMKAFCNNYNNCPYIYGMQFNIPDYKDDNNKNHYSLQKALDDSYNDYDLLLNNFKKNVDELHFESLAVAGRFHGIVFRSKFLYDRKNKLDKVQINKAENEILSTPFSSWIICMNSSTGYQGHAIALFAASNSSIKESSCFLFDPNEGVFSPLNKNNFLWEYIFSIYMNSNRPETFFNYEEFSIIKIEKHKKI